MRRTGQVIGVLFVIVLAVSAYIIIKAHRDSSEQPELFVGNKIEIIKENRRLQNSPIFKKALTPTHRDQIVEQIDKLNRENIKISHIYTTDDKDVLKFLTKLQSCEKCKKVFAFFSSNGIRINLYEKNDM